MITRSLVCVWFALPLASAVAQTYNFHSYRGEKPPELLSSREHWIGSDKKITLKELEGSVVWLQFNFGEACTSLRSTLSGWEDQYGDSGLAVIEVNQCLGEPIETMRLAVDSKHLQHPVLWDRQSQNTHAYGIKSWPFVYLIGTDGTVFWEGNPARWIRRPKATAKMRKLIEGHLPVAAN